MHCTLVFYGRVVISKCGSMIPFSQALALEATMFADGVLNGQNKV
jgi:hypothetical protein